MTSRQGLPPCYAIYKYKQREGWFFVWNVCIDGVELLTQMSNFRFDQINKFFWTSAGLQLQVLFVKLLAQLLVLLLPLK